MARLPEQSRRWELPGTSLIRTNAATARTLQKLTDIVRTDCDTFYSAPGFDSLYVYTRLPTPTGLLSNSPGALTTSEQREVASQLAALRAGGKRVCMVTRLDADRPVALRVRRRTLGPGARELPNEKSVTRARSRCLSTASPA